jgi:dipeptidyl aminopeptidase/acylaminoacyl peptidase
MWHFYPDHYMFSYQLNRILAQSHYGGGEFFESIEAASRITPGDFKSFHDSWAQAGNETLALAEENLAKGYTISARQAYLRASNYLRTSEFFLKPEDPRKVPGYKKATEAFQKGAFMLPNPPGFVSVPFEGSEMTGYFMQPDGAKENGPLMIMFGGLDSTAEELYFGPWQKLEERGISLLMLDGPGQGGSLRLRHMLTRYDYEVPATTAFDWAVTNLPVDPKRIGIMAVSMGGYMAARAAAFEKRFKVCCIWGAVWSYYDIWKNRPDNHPLASIMMHITGSTNMTEAREKLKNFTLEGVADKISIPTFISHGEDDKQNFVENAYKLFDALSCEKELNIAPKERTGSSHCHVDNFTKVNPMFDWLQTKL